MAAARLRARELITTFEVAGLAPAGPGHALLMLSGDMLADRVEIARELPARMLSMTAMLAHASLRGGTSIGIQCEGSKHPPLSFGIVRKECAIHPSLDFGPMG